MRFEIETAIDTVDFWTDARLPSEPRDTAKEARARLRAALVALKATGDLTATYQAAPSGLCDLEDVLMYNVGTGTFTRLAERRLLLVRRLEAPRPTSSGFAALHHHRYATAAPACSCWQTTSTVGERRFTLRMPLHIASVWLAARECVANEEHVDAQGTTSGALGLTVEIELPRRSSLRLSSILKALLDGIVCSFHRHAGPGDLDELSKRVAAKLRGAASAEHVKHVLVTGPSELGPRRLLHAFGASVQWNPADDGLVMIDARVVRSDTDEAACHARLVQLAPAVVA